ncbi:ead/Ea22-like family protein [Salmonella enterica subsp. diarizonae]|nr:ead/Ea22-like family protein [Salmonella enterica subsp. diarizonae]
MSNIDKQALREAAEKVNSGDWSYEEFDRLDLPGGSFVKVDGRDAVYCLSKPVGGIKQSRAVIAFIATFNPKVALALLDENIQLQREKDATEAVLSAMRDDMRQAREQLKAAEHTAAVDHEAACSLVEENEELKRRIAELERSETQLINERDSAESALNDAYKAVMGQAPEWSNWFSFENAIDEIELACEQWRNQTDDVIQFRQRIQELEAREVNLPPTFWYEHDDLSSDIPVLDKRLVEKAIRAAGIGVKEE